MAFQVITYCDVVRKGACVDGVIDACKSVNFYAGTVSDALRAFKDQASRILQAVDLDGSGYGSGYGYGDGHDHCHGQLHGD